MSHCPKLLLNILGVVLVFCVLQSCAPNYYAIADPLVIRNTPNPLGDVEARLEKFVNVRRVDSVDAFWSEIKYYSEYGYVLTEDIRRGKTQFVTRQVKVAAVCKDGSEVKSDSDSACLSRGGLDYWRTRKESTVRIKEPN